MVSGSITVATEKGLHMRPAKVLCKVAAEYKCKVTLKTGSNVANAKSLLSVLGARIKTGMEVFIVCDGEDEEEAFRSIMNVISDMKES